MNITNNSYMLPVLLAALMLAPTISVAQQASSTATSTEKKANGLSKKQIVDLLNQVAKQAPYIPEKLSALLREINKDSAKLSETDVQKAVKILLGTKITPEQRIQLKKIQTALSAQLASYKASGPAFAADFNGGFILDTQDPRFTVTYKDAQGNTKNRTYQADISLVGLNIELALRLNLIFFVGTDFNFHETDKVIQLGTGIQVNPIWFLSRFSDFFAPVRFVGEREAYLGELDQALEGNNIEQIMRNMRAINARYHENNRLMKLLSYLDLTYVPFINTPGGMIIVAGVASVGDLYDRISIVTGGTLTPVADPA